MKRKNKKRLLVVHKPWGGCAWLTGVVDTGYRDWQPVGRAAERPTVIWADYHQPAGTL